MENTHDLLVGTLSIGKPSIYVCVCVCELNLIFQRAPDPGKLH